MEINKRVEYNSQGQLVTLTIQTDWDSKEVIDTPARCSACPAGFSCSGDCGRNAPFQDEDYRVRPKTCKLKKVNLLDVLSESLGIEVSQQKRYKRATHRNQLRVGVSAAFLKDDDSVDVYRGKAIYGKIVAIIEPRAPIEAYYPYTQVHNTSKALLKKMQQSYTVVLQRVGENSYYLNIIPIEDMESLAAFKTNIGILEEGEQTMAKKNVWQALIERRTGKIVEVNKFPVVYENKTYYYCKVNGTDKLKEILVADVDKEQEDTLAQYIIKYSLNGTNFTEKFHLQNMKAKLQRCYDNLREIQAKQDSLVGDKLKVEDEIAEIFQQYPEWKEVNNEHTESD